MPDVDGDGQINYEEFVKVSRTYDFSIGIMILLADNDFFFFGLPR